MNFDERSFENMLIYHRNELLLMGKMPFGKVFNRYERRKLTQYGILTRAKYEMGRPLILTPEAQEYLSTSPEHGGRTSSLKETT